MVCVCRCLPTLFLLICKYNHSAPSPLKTLFLAVFLFFFAEHTACLGQKSTWIKWQSKKPAGDSDWKVFQDSLQIINYLDSISRSFQKEGFLEIFRESKKTGIDSMQVEFFPGPKYSWAKVDTGHVPMELVKQLGSIGKDYLSIFDWMDRLILASEDRGYPFATANLDSFILEGDSIEATVNFDFGPLITWDSVAVSGQTKTLPRYVQNITGIEPGKPFSQKEFEKGILILGMSPYFTIAGRPEISFQTKRARPTFNLRDRNANVLDGIIGLLPNENEPGKMLLTGQLDLELYHLSGKGRDIALHWQRLNISTQTLELKAKESFLFNSPLDLSLGFNLLKQDTTFLNRSFSLDFGYRLSGSGYLKFFTKRIAGNLISTAEFQNIKELPNVSDFRWNQYGIGLDWNKLDSPVFPRNGFWITGEFSAGNKEIIENIGIPEEVYTDLVLNSPQYLGKIDLQKHFYLKPTWGIMLKVSGGFTQNQNLFLNDLFRIGGLKTIRGFNENYFYARSYGYMNVEQRLFFQENSFLMVFADVGVLENPYFVTSINKPFSFGAGVNLDTGSGIFRFIYGVGKSNSQPLAFSYSRIHFGYLARF